MHFILAALSIYIVWAPSWWLSWPLDIYETAQTLSSSCFSTFLFSPFLSWSPWQRSVCDRLIWNMVLDVSAGVQESQVFASLLSPPTETILLLWDWLANNKLLIQPLPAAFCPGTNAGDKHMHPRSCMSLYAYLRHTSCSQWDPQQSHCLWTQTTARE